MIQLYEDCMGRLHLRMGGILYCNVQDFGGSFLADARDLLQGTARAAWWKGMNYDILEGMFRRPGGPRLLAMWEDGKVLHFSRPGTPTGYQYLMAE